MDEVVLVLRDWFWLVPFYSQYELDFGLFANERLDGIRLNF